MNSQTVLISGAGGNLGKAVAAEFLKNNWKVAALVNHKGKDNPGTERYTEFEIDLTDEQSAEKLVGNLIDTYKTIDTAVLTAGGFQMGSLENTTRADLKKMFDLNFYTAYNLVRPLTPHLKETGGNLFLIGSQPGFDTRKGKSTVAYSLSKSLLFQLANIVNAGFEEIRAHVIVPDTIDTPENRKSMPKADFNKWQAPEAIAKLIFDQAESSDKKNNPVLEVKNYI